MAKKVVATLGSKSKKVNLTKVIIPYKNEKTGAYAFKTAMVPSEKVNEYLKENS